MREGADRKEEKEVSETKEGSTQDSRRESERAHATIRPK